MVASTKMVAEAEVIRRQSIPVLDMQYLCVPKANNNLQMEGILDVSSPSSPIFRDVLASESISAEISRFESASFPDTIQDAVMKSSTIQFVPSIRSW
ncbi:hypothetical protein L1049_016484 [Liquidambar formosana]|uniref:Uncharacterized protein n=1 Tax=Liquidambar formosana TaxID=63359 RepID=A0AAP0X0L7_LIQFO